MIQWPSVLVEKLSLRSLQAWTVKSPQAARKYYPRKKKSKNRRMLFDRRKTHRPQQVPASQKSTDFTGFEETEPDIEEAFRGFHTADILNSLALCHEIETALEEKYLMPFSPTPGVISCTSIPVSCCGPEYLLQILPVPSYSLRVLSLFDGISTGLHILRDRLNLQVDVYFSSEIDQDALKVQRHNNFGNMISLGDVRQLNDNLLHSLGRIDLLIGGSPCNELSMVNPNRKGLSDVNSTGHLFYEYVRVRNFLRNEAGLRKTAFFWMFENTSHMDKHTKLEMSRALGSDPVVRCSSVHLPVKRRRLFWGDLPQMHDTVQRLEKSPLRLQDMLKQYRHAVVDVLPTLTTSSHSQRSGYHSSLPIIEEGHAVGLSVVERELVFGFPPHYTDTGDLNNHRRAKLLGKSWSVPVVTELLRPLSEIYKRHV